MAYHIEKIQQIQDKVEIIYYEGDFQWSTVFENRKIYSTEGEAQSELYNFGGTVVSE